MQPQKEMFGYEAPSRSIKVPKYAIVVLGIVAVGIAIAVYIFSKQDGWAMQSMGEKFSPEVKKALDQNDLNQAFQLLRASWVFAKEIEYVKGNTPSNTGQGVEGTGLMTLDEFRKKVEQVVLKPDQALGAIDDKEYSSILSRVLTAEDLKQLEQIRNKNAYWSRLKDLLAFQPEAISSSGANESEENYAFQLVPNRSDGHTIKVKKLPYSQSALDPDSARLAGQFGGSVSVLNQQKELDPELIVKKFTEIYGYERAHSEGIEFCIISTAGKQCYQWPRGGK